MKKGMVKAILVVVFFGMTFVNVLAQSVENRFMDTGVPISDHVVLAVHPNVGVFSVDGSMARLSSMGNLAFNLTTKAMCIPLPPGEHELVVRYFDQSISGSGDSLYMNTTETEFDYITYKFEKGRYYYLYPIAQGAGFTFRIIDETDSNDKNVKKRIADSAKAMKKAKYPKKDTKAMDFQRAVGTAPTVLEGTWVLSTDPQFAYTFSGGTAQLGKQREHPSYRGIMELTGNTLTINYIQADGTGTWTDILLVTLQTTYEYYINAEGHLVLTRTGGKNDTETKRISAISVENGVFIKK